jgi:hypothetical protein
MFFIVIPKFILINEELEGYILVNNKTIIMIKNFSFIINDYLFYQINVNNTISYEIYNYNKKRICNEFTNIILKKTINTLIFSNNIIQITYNLKDKYIFIKAKECIYLSKKIYFNSNKELIIKDKIKTSPPFETYYSILLSPDLSLPDLSLPDLSLHDFLSDL